jgi:hypothetical protein
MKTLNLGMVAGAALRCGSAWAADFGVMETAESIEPKAFKLVGFPLLSDRPSGDEAGAFAIGLGYGLPFNLDVEGQVARDDVATYYGSDVEWSPWRYGRMQVSLGSGFHTIDIDRGGSTNGADATAIFTFTPIHRLDLNAALDASYEDVDAGSLQEPNLPERWRADNEYETYYFAPGLEYALMRDLDLLAEVGIGLNGASDDYASAGLSWYIR